MAEKEKVFNFIIGLKPWARNEVKRQNIKTLEEAFVAVDRLVEHYDEGIKERKKKTDKPKEKFMKEKPSRSNNKSKMNKHLKCWIYEEPHTGKNCPSRPKVAVVAHVDAKKRKEESSIGVMQILGAAVALEAVS